VRLPWTRLALAALLLFAVGGAAWRLLGVSTRTPAGRRREALSVLRAAEIRHPYDLDILGSLVSMSREAGNARDALFYARKIAEVFPEDPAVKRLLAELMDANAF